MKNRMKLFIMMACMLCSWVYAFGATQTQMRAPAPLPSNPGVRQQARPQRPAFTSTVPSPFKLAPGRPNQFTITGTALGSVTGLTLINPQNTRWRMPAQIVINPTGDAITVTVVVPKYLAVGPYHIHATAKNILPINTGLTVQADEVKPSQVWNGFLPILHGFNFNNSGWGAICFQISGGRLVYKPDSPHICDNGWGLCGGMSLNAGERYLSGFVGTHDLDKFRTKPDIINAQFRTLDGSTVAKFLEWIVSPDEGHWNNPRHSVGHNMAQDWNGPIKAALDAYRPVVLGLIFDKSATALGQINPLNVDKLTKQHQVLGFGYSRFANNVVQIAAYDPNYQDDILFLTFRDGATGVQLQRDSGNPVGHRPVRGVLFVRNVP